MEVNIISMIKVIKFMRLKHFEIKWNNLLFFLLSFLTVNVFGQETDYCFWKNDNWGDLHQAVCFEAKVPLNIGKIAAEVMQSNYKPMHIKVPGNPEWLEIDKGYHMQEFGSSAFNGATRIVVELGTNLTLIFAYFPHFKDNYDSCQIVAIVKNDGKCQLICEKVVTKEKVSMGSDSKGLYYSFVDTNVFKIGGKSLKYNLNLWLENGTRLSKFNFGDYEFLIPN